MSTLEQQLIDLQSRIAHQEFSIEELQRFTLEQAKMIDKLEKSLKFLAEKLESVATGSHKIGPGNEKPPHY